MEERLLEQELSYKKEQPESGIVYSKVTVVDLRIELTQKSILFNCKWNKDRISQLLYNRRLHERMNDTFTPADDTFTRKVLKMPSPIDNKKNSGGNIFSGIDAEYHREVVGTSSSPSDTYVRSGTKVLAVMEGMTPGRSRIYPTTDFVYLVLNKNSFIWNSVQATTHKIRHGANVKKNMF